MNKRKILTLALTLCLVAILAVGGTLAYLTDNDKAENVFSVGKVDITLTETNKINDTAVTSNNFTGIMPGDTITKTPVIKNVGDQDAYVRVFVTLNTTSNDDLVKFKMDAMDTYFETKYGKNTTECNNAYNSFFNGWGMNYQKNLNNGVGMRFWLSQRGDNKVLNIDSLRVMGDGSSYQYAKENAFMTAAEVSRKDNDCQNYLYNTDKGYYSSLMTATKGQLIYVFYLKLGANEEYTLFNGFNVPTEFDNAELSFFDGLKIGVYADAIQTAGFEATEDGTAAWKVAIEELNKAHPMGWWKNN